MKGLTWSVSKVTEYLLCSCLNSRLRLCMVQKFTDTEAYADECVFFWTINKANIFLGLIEYELNSLLRTS